MRHMGNCVDRVHSKETHEQGVWTEPFSSRLQWESRADVAMAWFTSCSTSWINGGNVVNYTCSKDDQDQSSVDNSIPLSSMLRVLH